MRERKREKKINQLNRNGVLTLFDVYGIQKKFVFEW